MTETIQSFFQVIQWVGSLFGLIGGLILIIRFFKERPILKSNVLTTHVIDVDEGDTTFHIDLDIDNIGDKSTTIKAIYVIISDKTKKDSWNFIPFEEFKMVHLNPRSSMQFSKEVILDEIIEEDIEIEVQVDHTHGYEEIKSESFFISDDLLEDDDK